MKRLIAIFFLCLLLFNTVGYRLWFGYAKQQAAAQLALSVENEDYDASELITLSVPLTLPYQTDWAGWEKVRGQIEIDGITYQYVQRKVEGGKMYLQCLPNHQQAKIESARDRFFHLANSFQADDTNKKEPASHNTVKLTKAAFTDFDDHQLCWGISGYVAAVSTGYAFVSSFLPHNFLPVPAQPPELTA